MPLIGTSTSASAKGYGMLASGSIDVDPFFSNVSALLHGDGTNGAQNNTFIDGSINSFTITRNGSATQGSFSPFALSGNAYSTSLNGGSGYFDGSGSLSVSNAGGQFDMNAAFTAEAWIYQTVGGSAVIMGVGGGAASWSTTNGHEWLILPNLANVFYFQYNNSGAVAQLTTTNPPLNQWNHIAVGYNGTTLSVWINGVRSINGAVSITLPTTRNIFRVGSTPAGDAIFTGYISNVRIVKGTDVYGVANTTITVPTAPLSAVANTSLLLNFTNAGIFDNAAKNNLITVGSAQVSSAQIKFGTGSMLFNGTTDYLLSPSNASTSLGAGNFTIEFWINPSSVASESVIVDLRSGSASVGPTVGFSAGGAMYIQTSGASVITGATLSTSTWTHIAVSRSVNDTKLFVNGVQSGTTYTTAYTPTSPARVCIGARDNGTFGLYFNGHIDDLRITKGIARYTANFNPPTQAFPNS